jgi:ADP-glucose pyrophosphorylase
VESIALLISSCQILSIPLFPPLYVIGFGQNVRVHSYCHIEDSILLDWAEIGRGCRIRRAIIDKYNIVLPGTEIGYNVTEDRERYFVSEAGIVVIPRAAEKKTWVHLNS